MSEQNMSENRYFGRYLRRIREDRKLSLDAVEEMTVGYPEPVTKSHLSRIENGRAVPTFPRMFALCQVYGVPISSMAERFETDLRRKNQHRGILDPANADEFVSRIQEHRREGRYGLVLQLASDGIDELKSSSDEHLDLIRRLSIWQVGAMIRLEHFESCKLRCEELISEIPKTSEYHLRALLAFVECAFRLGRCAVAVMGLDQVARHLRDGEWPADLVAIAHSTDGMIRYSLEDLDRAKESFEAAVSRFDEIGNDLEGCRARINLAQVLIDRDQPRAALHYLTRAIKTGESGRFQGLLTLAYSHLALVHFKMDQFEAAERCALKSNNLGRELGYNSTIFRNCYYLWKLAEKRGDRASAVSHEHNLRSLINRVPQDVKEVERYRHERGDR